LRESKRRKPLPPDCDASRCGEVDRSVSVKRGDEKELRGGGKKRKKFDPHMGIDVKKGRGNPKCGLGRYGTVNREKPTQ